MTETNLESEELVELVDTNLIAAIESADDENVNFIVTSVEVVSTTINVDATSSSEDSNNSNNNNITDDYMIFITMLIVFGSLFAVVLLWFTARKICYGNKNKENLNTLAESDRTGNNVSSVTNSKPTTTNGGDGIGNTYQTVALESPVPQSPQSISNGESHNLAGFESAMAEANGALKSSQPNVDISSLPTPGVDNQVAVNMQMKGGEGEHVASSEIGDGDAVTGAEPDLPDE